MCQPYFSLITIKKLTFGIVTREYSHRRVPYDKPGKSCLGPLSRCSVKIQAHEVTGPGKTRTGPLRHDEPQVTSLYPPCHPYNIIVHLELYF